MFIIYKFEKETLKGAESVPIYYNCTHVSFQNNNHNFVRRKKRQHSVTVIKVQVKRKTNMMTRKTRIVKMIAN